jgi:hypothetical protein
MDNETSGIIAIIGLVISVGGSVLAIVNHKRLRSTCCGKKIEASIDIEETTPPTSLPPKISSDV